MVIVDSIRERRLRSLRIWHLRLSIENRVENTRESGSVIWLAVACLDGWHAGWLTGMLTGWATG